jgi:hypothetical protein
LDSSGNVAMPVWRGYKAAKVNRPTHVAQRCEGPGRRTPSERAKRRPFSLRAGQVEDRRINDDRDVH